MTLIQFRFPAFGARLTALGLLALAACGGPESGSPSSTPASQPASNAVPAVKLTGKVIEIEMYTDEKGNYFKPNEIEAHRGDVLRFVLKSGVHNVNFLPDSNSGKAGLPPVSEFFQLPGQTWDLTVSVAPGQYYFQCDPHAALGMVAKLKVEDEKH